MRVLFYTATALFILLAGIFAFYALRAPASGGGAKVVLSIDASQMPGASSQASQGADGDLLAEAAARLKRADASDTPPDAIKPSLSAEAASPGTSAAESEGTAQGQIEDQSDTLPGTTLAGLDGDKPPLDDIDKGSADLASHDNGAAAQPEPPSAQPNREGVGQGPSSTQQELAERETSQPTLNSGPSIVPAEPGAKPGASATADTGLQAAAPPEDTGNASGAATQTDGGKTNVNAVLAALNEKDALEPAAPTVPPPPLPYKRPGNIPSTKTAALEGWKSTKFTTTEVAAPRSARIAILLRGIGRDDRISDDAITKLPPPVSLAFVPYAGSSQQWAKKALELGHEVIVQLPLEPSDYPVNNPGPETLLSSSGSDENLSRLHTVLSRFDGYSGVTNFLGGRLLQSKVALRPILEEVKAKGLIYVGEGNNSHAVVQGVAKEIGLRYGNADVMIDAQPSPTAIRKALDRLVVLARKQGSAIGMGTASRTTIEQLESWSQQLGADGVTLVPVGVLAQAPGAS